MSLCSELIRTKTSFIAVIQTIPSYKKTAVLLQVNDTNLFYIGKRDVAPW